MAGSVSSHLTPEPERRLWLILDSMRQEADGADLRAGFLILAAALELGLLRPAGPAAWALLASLPLSVLCLSPWSRSRPVMSLLAPGRAKPTPDDSLISPEEVTKYSLGELIHKLDRYLGGGITATQYYEDLVSQILAWARLSQVKRRLLAAGTALVGLGQLLLAL